MYTFIYMTKLITTPQVQKEIGDENIADYMEDFEMMKNREKLQNRYKKSSKSGRSSLIGSF